ncbi:unnamed protein product [Microthlaspi erraticum]|uniref:RRM domain-containing protein n=1 Tax=Microthlaspi erraticum TaxID=1685480 RepID=A0A6D2L379_9BRAS|nr:unnamed protein product [Microthlaspi erraticum]
MSLIKFHDFYGVWSKTVTETCLPLFSSADPASELSTRITFILCSLQWYYETLNAYAKEDSKTITNLLFPSWRDSLEKPILFLGDIHPFLLTNILRSLINRVNQDAGKNPATSEDPYVELLKKTEELEGEIESSVSHLLDRMSKAQIRYAARFSDNWVSSYDSSQWRTVMEMTAASMAKEEIMKELVGIFVDANLLRMKLIKDIVDATSGQILMLASLFLESVCRIFYGFKDQGQEFHYSLSASPLMNHHHASEPALPTCQTFPVKNQQPTVVPVHFHSQPVPPPYQTFPVMKHTPTAVPAHFHSRPVPPTYHTYPVMNQHPTAVPAHFHSRPVPPPYQTNPVMNQQPIAVPAHFHSRPVQPPYQTSPVKNQQHTAVPAHFHSRLVPRPHQTYPVTNQQPRPAGNQAPEINNNAPIPEYTIYVGDLNYQVKAFELGEKFRERYPSVKAAKVKFSRDSRRTRGYGFVSFSDVNEQRRAMTEMNGQLCHDKPMRIGPVKRIPRPRASFFFCKGLSFLIALKL